MMNYLLLVPIGGLGLIQVVTWFGVLPPAPVSLSLSVGSVMVFLIGLVASQRYAAKNNSSLGEKIMGSLNAKKFFAGLLLVAYFFFNFFYSTAKGGSTKIEEGEYFAMHNQTKVYYVISKAEYDERQPHQLRAWTGHAMAFGLIGLLLVRVSRST